jgi:methylmalonyl-CoA mutase N-terminal domain/subunit
MWARIMREEFKAQDPRSWMLRFHTQTAGSTLTSQQPDNNVVRVTIQALAAVLGGTQSLHTNSRDEALSLPSEESARLALRTQQVLAEESGVADVVDPLGGAPFVEELTDRVEAEALELMAGIDEYGGAVAAIEAGFLQREIADASHRFQREVESKDRIIVGVNDFKIDEPIAIPILEMDPDGESRHMDRLRRTRSERNADEAQRALAKLATVCADPSANTMPHILDAVNAWCSVGEIMSTMSSEFGEYRESVVV